jgi:hypothetical protein
MSFREMKIWAVAGYDFLTVANLNLMYIERSGRYFLLAIVWGVIEVRLALQQETPPN